MYGHTLTGMASPYTPGEISNSTQYTMPNGRMVTALNDGPSYDDLLRRMEFASGRSMSGGGGSRGNGGGGGGGGGSLSGAYGDAYNSARNANESRYNDILAEYDKMIGGGGKPAPARRTASVSGGLPSRSKFRDYQNSGSTLGFFDWLNTSRGLEHTAAQRGGAYGGIDATGVYPRMYGNGEFMGTPPSGQQPVGGAYGQRPTIPPPVYPTYTPPKRSNVNY